MTYSASINSNILQIMFHYVTLEGSNSIYKKRLVCGAVHFIASCGPNKTRKTSKYIENV